MAPSGRPVEPVSAVEKAPRMSVPHGVWARVQTSRDRDDKTYRVVCKTGNPQPSADPALLPFLMYRNPHRYRCGKYTSAPMNPSSRDKPITDLSAPSDHVLPSTAPLQFR